MSSSLISDFTQDSPDLNEDFAAADTLIPNLTVYEMLMYTIELKLERKIPLKQKILKVEAVMEQLNLRGCQGVRIGNSEARGISGSSSGQVSLSKVFISLNSKRSLAALRDC